MAELVDGARWWRRAGLVVGRGNGKSDGVLCPYVLDSLEQGIGVLGLAQNLDVAMDTFNKVADTIESDPHLKARIRKLYRGKGSARIDLYDPRSGRVAVYRPAVTAKKCRGPRAPRLAVDESAYVANEVLSAARYVQNGSGQVDAQQILAVCTAGDDQEDASGELHWFSRWRNAHLEDLDDRLLWLEYSIPEDADPTDRAWWPYAVPALGHFITELEISDNLDDPDFVREALSRWGVTSQRAIPADVWRPCAVDLDAYAPLQVLGLGVAVAKDETSAALAAAYKTPDGRTLVKILDEQAGTTWAISVAHRWSREARVPVLIDAYGPAGPLSDDLANAGVHTEVVTSDTYAKACAAFLRDARSRQLAHYAQPALDDAVAAARQRQMGDRWVWARRAGDIAALEAATLAAVHARYAPTRTTIR